MISGLGLAIRSGHSSPFGINDAVSEAHCWRRKEGRPRDQPVLDKESNAEGDVSRNDRTARDDLPSDEDSAAYDARRIVMTVKTVV